MSGGYLDRKARGLEPGEHVTINISIKGPVPPDVCEAWDLLILKKAKPLLHDRAIWNTNFGERTPDRILKLEKIEMAKMAKAKMEKAKMAKAKMEKAKKESTKRERAKRNPR